MRNKWMFVSVAAGLTLAGCVTMEAAPKGEEAYEIIPPAPLVGADYRIGADDVLRIEIYHEPGLSREDVQVMADGTVRMPLIGDVSLAGLSATEAADILASRYGGRYLVSPQITVFVKKPVSRRITVDGEVRTPGLYPIEGRIGLVQAVALAQGSTRFASQNKVVVVRTVDGERQAGMFDLSAIRKGEVADPEILPGDMVIVGLSRAKAILGGVFLALPVAAAGFVMIDGAR